MARRALIFWGGWLGHQPEEVGQLFKGILEADGMEVTVTDSLEPLNDAEYLKSLGIQTIAPYNLEQTEKVCAALAAKRQLKTAKFLVYQDDPGEGFQASIFKRFYWWEEECTRRLSEKFGVRVVKKSFRRLGETDGIYDPEA